MDYRQDREAHWTRLTRLPDQELTDWEGNIDCGQMTIDGYEAADIKAMIGEIRRLRRVEQAADGVSHSIQVTRNQHGQLAGAKCAGNLPDWLDVLHAALTETEPAKVKE